MGVSRVLYLTDMERGRLTTCDRLGSSTMLLQTEIRALALAVYPQKYVLGEVSGSGGRILRAGHDDRGGGGGRPPPPRESAPR